MNDPGVEAEAFLYQAAASWTGEGRKVVYVVTARPPSGVVKAMDDHGFDVSLEGTRLTFIDAFSGLMGAVSDAKYLLNDPTNPEAFADLLERAAGENPDALLLIESLSTLADTASPEKLTAAFPRILAAMKRFPLGAASFTKWPYDDQLMAVLGLFDGVVTLKNVEARVSFGQYFAVERARWKTGVETRPRLYKILKPGGVVVYIPKIVVTGPFHAGKSTFIHTVSDSAVSVNRVGTTVAMDHGHVLIDGLSADIFGTPGQERFDPILRTIAGQALGVIVVVDSTDPDSFPRAREMMQLTWKQGLPAIIAASKQDMPEALTPDRVAVLVGAPEYVKCVGFVGTERQSTRNVLKELLEQILEGGAAA